MSEELAKLLDGGPQLVGLRHERDFDAVGVLATNFLAAVLDHSHQVAREARARGAIIRPLGDVVVLMPPLAISAADLRSLVEIVADSIRAGCASATGEQPTAELAAAA